MKRFCLCIGILLLLLIICVEVLNFFYEKKIIEGLEKKRKEIDKMIGNKA